MIEIPNFKTKFSPLHFDKNSNLVKSMHDELKIYGDSLTIVFGKGKIDEYCVYIKQKLKNGTYVYFPAKDEFYFERLKWMSTITSPEKVWTQFVSLYSMIYMDIKDRGHLKHGKLLNREIAKYIIKMCDTSYVDKDNKSVEVIAAMTFAQIYYGILAEEYRVVGQDERKRFSDVGGLIKLHAIHSVLFSEDEIECICNYDRDKRSGEIARECLNEFGLARDKGNPEDLLEYFERCEK